MFEQLIQLLRGKRSTSNQDQRFDVSLDINDILGLYNAGNAGVSPVLSNDDYSSYIDGVYEFNATAASAINLLVNTMTSIPLKYTIGEGDKKEDITNDESYEFVKLLNNPNKDETKSLFRRTMYLNNLITGNSFIWTVKSILNEKEVISWRNIPVQDVVLQVVGLNEVVIPEVVAVQFTYQSKLIKNVPYRDFIHIREPNLKSNFGDNHSFYGMPLLKSARQLIKASNETNNAAISSMTNNGASGILFIALDKIQNGMASMMGNSDVELSRLSDRFKKKTTGSGNYNSIETTNTPIDYKEIGRSLKDMDVSELQKSQMRMIANMFNLPTQLMNDPDSSTFANMGNAMIWLYTIAAIPRVKYANEFIIKNIREQYKEPTFNIEVDENSISEIQNSILEKKAQTVKDLNSWTINEQRKYTGQTELEGEIYNTPIIILQSQIQQANDDDNEAKAKKYIVDNAQIEFETLISKN